MCDFCSNSYHLRCIKETKSNVKGIWLCGECVVKDPASLGGCNEIYFVRMFNYSTFGIERWLVQVIQGYLFYSRLLDEKEEESKLNSKVGRREEREAWTESCSEEMMNDMLGLLSPSLSSSTTLKITEGNSNSYNNYKVCNNESEERSSRKRKASEILNSSFSLEEEEGESSREQE